MIFAIKLAIAPTHWAPPGGLVGFHADNGFDLILLTGAKKLNRPMHHSVVGQRQGGLAQALRFLNQIFDPAQPIKHGIFRVDVEVDEIVCHDAPCAVIITRR